MRGEFHLARHGLEGAEERRKALPPSHHYSQRDYEFANTFVTLRTSIGLTQQGLARHLGVASRTVENWEQGLTGPKAESLKAFLVLCVRASAFAGGHEEEQIRAFWRAARQKVLLDEHWLSELLTRPFPSTAEGADEPAPGSEQASTAASQELALWTVPYARNPHFTGREELLSHLEQQFARGAADQPTAIHQAALTQSQAIKGLGGIGKTQIAIEYAYRAREQGRYTHILWISAASEEALLASFAALTDRVPALGKKGESDQRALVKKALRWLEQSPEPWLLIYDNADDITLLPAYLPIQGQGSILFTTRASAVRALTPSLEVEALPIEEGVQLLLRRAGREAEVTEREREEASTIVLALGRFPLALDQAGAYLEETGCSLADYLQIYQQHQYQLLARRGKQVSGYPDSVATTWSLAFERVEQSDPAASDLLRLCTFVAPDQIPEELLTEGADFWPAALQEAVTDRWRFNQVLSALLAFSLIKRFGRERTLSVHRLVQLVQRERMTPEEQRQWAERLVRAMNAVFPREPEEVASRPLCQRYLEQGQACDTLVQHYQLLLPEAAELLDRVGTYLREYALYTLVEPFYRQAIRIKEQQGEPEDLSIASTLHGLAKLYLEQGKHTEAEPLYQRALRMREQQIGAEHPLVATSLNDLAALYRRQGKYPLAEPLYLRALSIRERHFGPGHLQTADSLNDLAVLYENQRKVAEAEPLSQRALAIREQHLGPEHPLVATSLNNLAVLYTNQGKYPLAEPLFLRALRIWEQQLGEAHPHVAYCMNSLAFAYREQGEYAKAEPLYLRALSILEKRLEPDHDVLAFSLSGLAEMYREQGKYAEAEPLYQRALAIRERRLGSEHRLIAITLNGLAHLYSMQDKFHDAEALYLRALRIQEQFGPEYRELAPSLTGLANLYAQCGMYTQAEPLYQRALRICEQQIGPEHPETAKVLDNFAGFQQAQGNTLEAAVSYKRALAIRETILGPEHPRTAETRSRLKAVLVALGKTPALVVNVHQEKGDDVPIDGAASTGSVGSR